MRIHVRNTSDAQHPVYACTIDSDYMPRMGEYIHLHGHGRLAKVEGVFGQVQARLVPNDQVMTSAVILVRGTDPTTTVDY